MIQIRFAELLTAKQFRDGKQWSMREIMKATGFDRAVLIGWRGGTLKRLSSRSIVKLCEFFECEVGELVVYVPDAEEQGDA